MTDRERFLRIERRRADDAPDSEAADHARIAAVIDAAPPSIPRHRDDLELAREGPIEDVAAHEPKIAHEIEEPQGAARPDLTIDTELVRGQPFVRCARCGADSSIHAEACASCSTRLDTAEQRAFNEKVWAAQTKRNERERAALAEMAQARLDVVRASVRPLPDPGMKPPPELLEPLHEHESPLLIALLKSLQSTKSRMIACGAVVVLPLFLVTLGGPILGKIGWAIVVLLLLGLLPRRIARGLFRARFGSRRG